MTQVNTIFTEGMQVLIRRARQRGRYAVGTVASVGKVVTLADGREYTLGGHGYNERIEPLTDEARARVAHAIEAQRVAALRGDVMRAVETMGADGLELVSDLIASMRAAE